MTEPSRSSPISGEYNAFARRDSIVPIEIGSSSKIAQKMEEFTLLFSSSAASSPTFCHLIKVASQPGTPRPSTTPLLDLVTKVLGDNRKVDNFTPTSFEGDKFTEFPVTELDLSLESLDNTDSALQVIRDYNVQFPFIQRLRMSGNQGVSPRLFDEIAHWKYLKYFHANGSSNLICNDPKKLMLLENLVYLDASCCYENINDSVLENIASLYALEDLNISWSGKISDKGVTALFANLKHLRRIDLSHCSEFAINEVFLNVKNLNSVREIFLNGTRLTDTGLKALSLKAKNLERISFDTTEVTFLGFSDLLDSHPRIQILSEDEMIASWFKRYSELKSRVSRKIQG